MSRWPFLDLRSETANHAVAVEREGSFEVHDGQRFVMIQEGGSDSAPTQINVVLNWFEELKQQVPTGN
ncbi:MAG: hypothetical protein O7E51_09200 [Acidobacteria bacterium]|nr:hypothetical protein [Acidobacteriota bacterium]